MKYLELTFDNPATNLACDEALLELYENDGSDDEILRIWEPRNYFAVLGHSNRWRSEVNFSACKKSHIPILRRLSGGGAVMQGPGCLNYCLILNSHVQRLKSITETFRYVLERHRRVVEALIGMEARIEGISDLAVASRKFSGNAQYRKARHVLVHGTFLLNFDLSLMAQFLSIPAKQPAYRQHRPHLEFVTNLNLTPSQLRDSIRERWNAVGEFFAVPMERIEALVRGRYGREQWSKKF